MKSTHYVLIILLAIASGNLVAQDCPELKDKSAAAKFLQDNKNQAAAMNPQCVDRAFATLRFDRNFIEVLVGLLDFERSIKNEISLITPERRYPAIGALETIGKPAVPRLIESIKNSERKLVRTNSTWALEEILHAACLRDVLRQLDAEIEKSETTPIQSDRLRESEELIRSLHHLCDAEAPSTS